MRQNLYVHLDGISNSVLSKGIRHEDFNRYALSRPRNLLLLNPYEREGEYEPHTGFRVIRGESQVEEYFETLEHQQSRDVKWLDFEDYEVLKRLTPNDISELLYFGHMKNQLRSPFFYKLKNDYAFFELGENVSKIYYRNIDEFYQIFSKKITEIVLFQINANRSFFSKKREVIELFPIEMAVELKSTMQEGIVFDFSQVGLQEKQYNIPILVVEDNLRKVENESYHSEDKIGTLKYCDATKMWQVEKEAYQSIFMEQ